MKHLILMSEAGDGADLGGSALGAVGATTPAVATPDANDWLPEKFRVVGEGDALDVTASARKMAEAYKHAEGRLGTGDAPPKSADEYEVKIESDVIKWDEFKADETNKAFLKAAHAKGMTNAQLEFVLGEYAQRAPSLVAGAAALDAESVTATLKETWGDDTPKHMGHAMAAARAMGITDEQLGNPTGIGNNAEAIKVLAFFGAQLGEDMPPAGGGVSADTAEDLMKSEAYMNPNHADHRRVHEQVSKHYQRTYK
jgi:hypothetical protein